MKQIIRFVLFWTLPFCFSAALGQAPTVGSPTVTGITHNSATLGGNVTSGSGITARGTAWKTSSPVVATDNQLAEGGTTTGVFTHSRSGLPSGTQLFFVAYATNGSGTTISGESSFYTLSAPPSGPVTNLTASSTASNSITLSFDAPTTVSAAGYAIYRRQASSVPGNISFPNAAAPPATSGSPTCNLVGTTTLASNTTFTDNTVTAGTQYSYAVIPYGFSGNAATYNYNFTTYATVTAYSLATVPTGQPALFSAATSTSNGETEIDLTFSTASSVGASGYAIYRLAGSTNPNVTTGAGNLQNANVPPATLATDGSILVTTITSSSATSFTDDNGGGGLTAGTQYRYAIVPYGRNSDDATLNYLIAGYKSATGFTFSTVPTTSPGPITIAAVSKTQINLTTFDDFATLGNANGYVLLRRIGSDPATSSVQDGVAPGSLVLGASTLVATITAAGTTSYNDGTPPLTLGTTYHYALVPFNWDGVNPQTYNYRVGSGFTTANATTFFAGSTITLNGGTQSNSTTGGIDYISNPTPIAPPAAFPANTITDLNSVSLAQFQINDNVGGNDGVGTTLTALTFTITNFANVGRIGIFDGSNPVGLEQDVTSGTISFSSLTITAPSNSTKNFQIRATFKTTVTDNQQINLTITAATASSAGSDFASANAGGAATSNANAINVIRTKLAYSPSATINAIGGQNFGSLQVRTLDANNNLDVDNPSSVTLSLSPVATITTTPSNGSNVSGGIINFTSLVINTPGSYTMTATYGSGSPAVATADLTVNVTSPGVTVNPGATPLTPCYNGNFQTLTPAISLVEYDNGDFAIGNNVTYSIILPPNFIFDTNVTSAPSVSGGSDISSPSNFDYSLGNNIVRFSYTITGTTNINTITLNGLKVKYQGTAPVTNVKILRLGGSAVQAGNSDTDAKNHGALSAEASTTIAAITVQQLPGNPVVSPNQTSFSASAQPVRLLASPAGTGGVFTGNGVSFSNSINGYIFTPSAVGSGSAVITYSANESSVQFCSFNGLATFNVISGVISGLASQYCNNNSTSVAISVLNTRVQTDWPPIVPPATPNSYLFNNFVYFDFSTLTWKNDLPSLNLNQFKASDYGVIVQKLINYYQSLGIPNPAPGVYIGYQVKDQADIVQTSVRNFDFVTISPAPVVTQSLPKIVFCSDEIPFTLTPFVTPTPTTVTSNDFFTATGSGSAAITNTGGNTWVFNPSNVTNASVSQQTFNLSYTYKNPSNGCSNVSVAQTITVNPKPGLVLNSDISPFNNSLPAPKNNIFTCQGTSPSSFSATLIGPSYKWYADAPLTDLRRIGNSFSPSVNVSALGTTSFYVTKTLNGCESDGLELAVTVKGNVVVDAGGGTAATICAGSTVDLVALTPSITGSVSTGIWSIVSGTGNFLDVADVNVNANPTLAIARKFNPDPSTQTSIRLRLTSSLPSSIDPNNSCLSSQDDVIITINPGVTISAGSDQDVCAGSPINLNGSSSIPIDTWSIVSGGSGSLTSPISFATSYTPIPTELTNGATIVFKLLSQDPDGPGPCNPGFEDVTIKIFPQATVSAGLPIIVCGTPTASVNLNSASVGGSATSGNWSGGGGIFSPSTITPATTSIVYTPSNSEKATNVPLIIPLTLTTNDPDGPIGPCTSKFSTMQLTINPTPDPPTVFSSAVSTSSTSLVYEYCSGKQFDAITAASSSGTIEWFLNNIKFATITATDVNKSINPSQVLSNLTTQSTIIYATETRLGCPSLLNTPVNIVVHPLPQANFLVSSQCLGDFTKFQDASSIGPPPSGFVPYTITDWEWDFGDGAAEKINGNGAIIGGTGNSRGIYKNPEHKFPAINAYNVILKVTSDKGCTSPASSMNPINIGPVPKSDFSLLDICSGDNTRFLSSAGSEFNESTDARTIKTWEWNFDDSSSGSNLSSARNPSHTFTGVKTYNVSLKQVSKLDCENTVIKPVYILPYITSFPYNEGFENGSGGWVGVGTNNASNNNVWTLGKPNGNAINTTNSGNNAWFISKPTNASSYDRNLRAVLNGPCFDVTKLQRPVLSVNYNNDTDQKDGAYMEVSTDGVTWFRLGTQNSGINWYDRAALSGLSLFTDPGQYNGIGQDVSQIGWNGTATGWKEGRIGLDAFLTRPKLRIRLVLGTNPGVDANSKFDGFALDDVSIDNRNRVLLVETFTNENASRYASNNEGFKSPTFNAEVAKIQYHTSFPTPDSQSPKNLLDNAARAAFYGINSNPGGPSLIPRSYIDGYTFVDPTNVTLSDFSSTSANSWWNSFSSTRVLSVSPLSIAVTDQPAPTNNQMSVNISIKATSAVTKKNLMLVIALVEKQVGANNTFVMRKLIPSAAGIPIATPIAQNAVITISQTFEVGEVNPAQLAVVAFVQDIDNSTVNNSSSNSFIVKEVIQAQILASPIHLPSVVTAVEPALATSLSFYPVPADKELMISLGEVAPNHTPVVVYDAVGKAVYQTAIDKGQQSKTVNTQDFAAGVYLIQLETEKGMVRKKVMVVH
jgi:Secretion system C-terminal sorting domain